MVAKWHFITLPHILVQPPTLVEFTYCKLNHPTVPPPSWHNHPTGWHPLFIRKTPWRELPSAWWCSSSFTYKKNFGQECSSSKTMNIISNAKCKTSLSLPIKWKKNCAQSAAVRQKMDYVVFFNLNDNNHMHKYLPLVLQFQKITMSTLSIHTVFLKPLKKW